MARINTKQVKNSKYYYLQHTYRNGKNIIKKELYLGKNIPENIDELKKNFVNSIYKERWFNVLENIKKNYSKNMHNLSHSEKEKYLENFMIKFTYDTQRIEGSKLTLRDTAELLERGITPKYKPISDVKEAETHREVFYEMLETNKDISLSLVLYWHKKLFGMTKIDIAGQIRKNQVAISGSRFMPPSPVEVYPLLMEFFKWHNKNNKKLHPVELAALVHLKFVTIHPFADGNGRISRLIMNFILCKKGYPMLDIPYGGRNSYYNALERSQVKNKEEVFISWFIKGYIKENKKYCISHKL